MVPPIRISSVNARPLHPQRDFVLYWMIAARRTEWNFALERAVEHAIELAKPLVVLEALRADYRWASDRLHRFVLEGMRDNARRLAARAVSYHPYVEPAPGAGAGLLEELGRRASVVVTDEFPCFFLPRMVRVAGRRLDVRLEAVDGNGLLPLRAADRSYPTAFAFRRFLQKTLPPHLEQLPAARPLERAGLAGPAALPASVTRAWPACRAVLDDDGELARLVARLPIDHGVAPAPTRGGTLAARRALGRFVDERLAGYADRRNEPEVDGTSGLSPWLHFGHLSVHEVFRRISDAEGWSPGDLSASASGRREGFWGMGRAAEAFLDELVTWREVGYNFSSQRDDYDRYESLPDWAQRTLAEHAGDERPQRYDVRRFEGARTHDPLWNAAQRQLVLEGRIHTYLRMLWGKKILEWSPTPREALATMIELNNKYALDGRDPNSYSGIFWVLGRFDRPWGPERPIFGTVRYMSSENTARKVRVRGYLERYGVS
jgi:deoxyribodipyrimidine photo-lyase